MHLPVLVTPASAPVSLANAKLHLHVDHTDDDTAITAFINAATIHVGRTTRYAVGTQTWRQDFDSFSTIIRLPIGPAASITSITYRDTAGDSTTVSGSNYELFTDALGPYVRFKDAYSLPSNLYQAGAVRITWVAGEATVPEDIVAAIKLIIGDLYQNREAKVGNDIIENQTVKNLLSTYRVF